MKTNTPNPLVPQGTYPDQQGKSRIRITVFAILAVHMVLLAALLTAGGCKKPPEVAGDTNLFPAPDTNFSFVPPPLPSNPAPDLATGTPPVTGVTPPESLVSPPAPIPTAEVREHVVVKGDSFYTLARKYNTTMKAIANENPGVDSSKLKIGQKLKIPASSGAPAPVTSSSVDMAPEKVHVVKSGETLSSIAKAEGTTVRALQTANNLSTTQIKVGQKLTIPSSRTAPPPATFVPAIPPVPAPATTTAPPSGL